ncbi:MAG: glycosyltransferase [Bacteroidales bacterium]|nr:glycosyltransferase [Bacteroidales bacterium]
MKLSVVIVNYNVRHFLDQCLHSVRRAMTGVDGEVFVVDNHSVDGSVGMIRSRFPEVNLIENRGNLGFSKANNQAIRKASGEYILLLNPDTVVEDDTFMKVIRFMDDHPEAGGMGVRMVDGKGRFLPESKRGLPTPAVAFYKISGLSRLFPKSRIFGGYHLGYLDPGQTHEVEILSGAFMMLRKSVLDEVGLLDEEFFMYGEDIDLSYRIIKAGYRNYYFPETRIIHYKGESTKKSSINYVVVFYRAMAIFARKHFSPKNARLFSLLINVAIYFRAFLALFSRFLSGAAVPMADAALLTGGIIAIKNYWEHQVIFPEGGRYPPELLTIAIPVYILILLLSVFYSGGYDRPVSLGRIFRGLFAGSVMILVIYALLPENYRFSRAVIIFGAVWGVVSLTSLRYLLQWLAPRRFRLGERHNRRYIIIGNPGEAERVAGLIGKTGMNPVFIGLVSINSDSGDAEGYIGDVSQIREIVRIYQINEVIFCARDIPAARIIDIMSGMSPSRVDFKIAPPESMAIIGSKSINTIGDIFIIELDSISRPSNRRSKRLSDLMVSVILVPLVPLMVWIVRKPSGFVRNLFQVIAGKKTWVGYDHNIPPSMQKLPRLRPGVLGPSMMVGDPNLSLDTVIRLNLLYARDYSIINDIRIILRGFRDLGRDWTGS